MNESDLSHWPARLLSGCRLAVEFLRTHGERFPDKRSQEKAQQVRASVERFMQPPEFTSHFGELAALALSAPGVTQGFIQQTAALDQTNVVRVPGGAGAWIHGHVYRDTFRVFIHTGTKFAEREHADLLTAIREAFAAVDVPLPEGLR